MISLRVFAATLLLLSFSVNAQPAEPEISCINCDVYPEATDNSFDLHSHENVKTLTALFPFFVATSAAFAAHLIKPNQKGFEFDLYILSILPNFWWSFFGNELMRAKKVFTGLFTNGYKERKSTDLKGVVIVFVPAEEGWNLGHRVSANSENLIDNYLYFTAKISKVNELEDVVERIKKSTNLPVKATVLNFHGNDKFMHVVGDDFISGGEQIIQFLNELNEDANIILNSCSTGSNEGIDQSSYNIAQSIAQFAGGKKVFATSGYNVGSCSLNENTLEPTLATITTTLSPFSVFFDYNAWLQQTKCYQYNKHSKTVVSCN